MLNKSTSRSKYVIQSGVTQYPIGFAFQHNGDGTPQIRVTIGGMVAEENVHFVISKDSLTIELISLGENDKWVGSALVIERDIPFVQESDYQVGRISPEQIEKDFDLSVMRDQMLSDEISKRADGVQGEINALHSRIDLVQEEHASDMATVNAEVATKATKAELEIVKNTLNSHTNELTTLSENQAELGSRVSGVEEKIPGDASGSNQLATKADLASLNLADYVKKSGDTMTGDLLFDVVAHGYTVAFQDSYKNVNTGNTDSVIKRISSYHQTQGLIFSETKNGTVDMQFTMIADGFFMPTGNRLLGSSVYPWANVYAKKLNNGADLIVPTEGGTLARIEDVDGYVKKSGDTMTGFLTFEYDGLAHPMKHVLHGGHSFSIECYYNNEQNYQEALNFSGAGLFATSTKAEIKPYLGHTDAPWYNVYAKKLNNGADIAIPTEGGTLARVEDLTDFAKKGDLSGYLPLSGGTLTGPLSVDGHSLSATIDNTFQIQTKGQRYRYYFGSQLWAESLVAGGETALGVPNAPWGIGYVKKLNNGTDLTVPTEGGTLARVEDINAIGGVGTAGQVLTKTEDGMAWQDATGGSSLPDQTGNAGKFLTTDGTTASWGGDNLVQDNANFKGNGLAVGAGSVALASGSTAYGTNSQAKGQNAVAIGAYSETSGQGVAIGGNAKSTALRAIQLGGGTNSDANTLKVGNANGNFEMMDANGNVPLERLTYVTNQIGDISTALTAILGE